jgi:hypothetical protein
MTGPQPPPFALDLDAPPIQEAVLRYLAQMGAAITRCADAVEQGNEGRARAIEELALLQVLAHYLGRRLGEPAPGAGPAGGRLDPPPPPWAEWPAPHPGLTAK